MLSGGEALVRVGNPAGRGGRNTTYALALAIALDGVRGISAIAADSDGIDGTSDAAGAIVRPQTLAAINELGDPAAMLEGNASHVAFAAAGTLVITGPTRTNVNDLRLILIDGFATAD